MPQARDEAGNIWEVDAQGNPVRMLQSGSAGTIIPLPADPTSQYEAPKAQADVARAQIGVRGDQVDIANTQSAMAAREASNRRAEATLPYEVRAAAANAEIAEAKARKTQQGGNSAVDAYGELQRIVDKIDAISADAGDNEGWGETGWTGAFLRNRPGTAAYGLAADLKALNANAAFRALQKMRDESPTGGALGQITERELELLQSTISNLDPDQSQEDFQARLREAREFYTDMQNRIVRSSPEQFGDDLPNAMTAARLVRGEGPGLAAAGSTQGSVPIPPEMQDEYDAYLAQNAGALDPEAYAAFRLGLDRKYGFDPNEGQASIYRDEALTINQGIADGGATNTRIPNVNRDLTEAEQVRNNTINSPLGAALLGATDTGSFGAVRGFNPEMMDAVATENPGAMMAGQIGGAIGGVAGLANATAAVAGGAAPQLLAGGARGQLARNLAADTGYAGIYSANSGGDIGTDMALGAVGSLGGQAVGKGLGGIIGGAAQSVPVRALRARNIPLTMGQKLGGAAKLMEDKAISVPIVGDMIRARRMEGLDAFNRNAMADAGQAIGYTPRNVGEEGVQELFEATSKAYDDATAGVTVPLDDQFVEDFTGAIAKADQLPKDLRRGVGQVLEARLAPATDMGTISGYDYQQAMRALKETRNNPPQRFQGFEQDYKDAITGAMDALTGQMKRGGGDQVVDGLGRADAAYRATKTVENAATRAAGGSQSGTNFVFTPSQLQRAGIASAKKYPGPRPFAELADAGQEVLPSQIPNSGTADRAAQMMLPGLIGGGAGIGALSDGTDGAATGGMYGAALAALLTAGGTRAGQKALDMAVISRPAAARQLGEQVNRRRGLFGHAGVPLMIAN